MKEELVTLETAQLARQKGFDEVCRELFIKLSEEEDWREGSDIFSMPIPEGFPEEVRRIYKSILDSIPTRNSAMPSNLVTRPTQDLLERWLREVHNIYLSIDPVLGSSGVLIVPIVTRWLPIHMWKDVASLFPSHELARETGLQHALKLLPDA